MRDPKLFERRLEEAFDRYLLAAPAMVDATAMTRSVAIDRPRPRRDGLPWTRGLAGASLVVGLAIIAVVLVGPGGRGPAVTNAPSPPASSSPSATTSPTTAPDTTEATAVPGAAPWELMTLRMDPVVPEMIDVVLVRPSGESRLLRRIPTALDGAEYPLEQYGAVAPDGSLAIGTTSSGQLPVAAYGLFDLAHASRDPLVVPVPPVISGQFSRDGLFALSSARTHSPTGWMEIDVVDPRTGATTALGKVGLFGGGPSIVWASDGSGILDSGRLQPAIGGADVDIDPDLTFLDRRLGMGASTVEVCDPALPGASCPIRGNASVQVHSLAGAIVTWWQSANPNDVPVAASFGADGQKLLVTFDRIVDGVHHAIVSRLDSPMRRTDLADVPLPADAWEPGLVLISPDDSMATIGWWQGSKDNPGFVAAAALVELDGERLPVPEGSVLGFVPGPAAESWPALQDFLANGP
ncbi:MAG: hypothetical protein ABIV26_06015 [Candidatus Limnocylindrales bacterium]